jgi:hypothetical protein
MKNEKEYQMIIHSDGSGVGHFTVEFRGEDGEKIFRGFRPEDKKSKNKAINLFGKPTPFNLADKSPKPWGTVLQDTINDVGGKPLKGDGWIGPKTTNAFDNVLRSRGLGGVMEKLGSNFGFF